MLLIASREWLRILVSRTNQIGPQEKNVAGLTYPGMIVSLFFFSYGCLIGARVGGVPSG